VIPISSFVLPYYTGVRWNANNPTGKDNILSTDYLLYMHVTVIQCSTTESVPATTIISGSSMSHSTLLSERFVRDVGSTLITRCNTTSGRRFDDGTTTRTTKCSQASGVVGVWSGPLYQCNGMTSLCM